jgi:hypothetical protein
MTSHQGRAQDDEKPLMDQSHFTNEPLFIALSGEALNKQQSAGHCMKR